MYSHHYRDLRRVGDTPPLCTNTHPWIRLSLTRFSDHQPRTLVIALKAPFGVWSTNIVLKSAEAILLIFSSVISCLIKSPPHPLIGSGAQQPLSGKNFYSHILSMVTYDIYRIPYATCLYGSNELFTKWCECLYSKWTTDNAPTTITTSISNILFVIPTNTVVSYCSFTGTTTLFYVT